MFENNDKTRNFKLVLSVKILNRVREEFIELLEKSEFVKKIIELI